MSDLSRLYFGRDDAESDFGEGGLLRAGFLRTAAYEAALTGKKQLIIGRKGSGKSAICMTLASNGHGYLTSLVTPDAMSLDEIRRFELQGITAAMAKSLFWRYILGIQTAKFVVAHAASDHRKSKLESVDKLRKFLLANGQNDDLHFHEQFWRSIQRLKSLSLGAFGVKVSIDINAPSEGLRTSSQLEIIERYVKNALSDLSCPSDHPHLLLLIDQIEQIWSNDPESDAMVTGLLLATKHASRSFPGVRCAVFLRTDIYEVLQFAERDKFRGDEMRIDWTPGSLLDLLLARARASLGNSITAEEFWAGVFPAIIDEEPAYSYMVTHTLARPRDLIQFANLCRDTAAKNGHTSVIDSDVKEAEVQFSQWKLDDLESEYRVNYPFLTDLFTPFQNSGYIISRNTLSERYRVSLPTLRQRFPEFVSGLTLDGVIDILYGIGFLGVRRKLQTVYSYQDPARVEPNESQFYIHPCFRQALRSATATDLKPYRPPPTTLLEADILSTAGRIGNVRLRGGRGYYERSSIERSVERILERLNDPQLAPDAAAEIAERVQQMSKHADQVRRKARSVDETELSGYIRWTCRFLLDLAQELQDGGMGDDHRIQTIARTIEDEARRLADEAGIRVEPRHK